MPPTSTAAALTAPRAAGVGTCFICAACGTPYPPSTAAPARCALCEDERQYVPVGGQRWTTLADLRRGHRNAFRALEPGLHAVITEPAFAINQRALLVHGEGGGVLWDCLALVDDATLHIVRALGGVRAIAISHPHYYTTCVDWARALDCPVLLHAADRQWVMRPDPAIRHWDGESRALDDLGLRGFTLVRCGGHFEGATVLHWAGGAGGRGALLSGDVLQVVPDRRHVSFMRSYPNLIPLGADAVRRVARAVEPLPFARVYGAFWDREIVDDAKGAVARSVERYLAAIAR